MLAHENCYSLKTHHVNRSHYVRCHYPTFYHLWTRLVNQRLYLWLYRCCNVITSIVFNSNKSVSSNPDTSKHLKTEKFWLCYTFNLIYSQPSLQDLLYTVVLLQYLFSCRFTNVKNVEALDTFSLIWWQLAFTKIFWTFFIYVTSCEDKCDPMAVGCQSF